MIQTPPPLEDAAQSATLQQNLNAAEPRLPPPVRARVGRRAGTIIAIVVLAAVAALALRVLDSQDPGDAVARPQPLDAVSIPTFPATTGREAAVGSRAVDSVDPHEAAADPAATADPASQPLRRPAVADPLPPLLDPHERGLGLAQQRTTLRERRMMPQDAASAGGDEATRLWTEGLQRSAALAAGESDEGASGQDASVARREKRKRARKLNLDAVLLRGTYIRCVLNNRIITDVPGNAACTVAEPVYSGNGRQLLLPVGTRVLGAYGNGDLQHERLAMVWDRILTPQGVEVELPNPGVDDMGSAGHPGRFTAHWGPRIASALFISLLSDGIKYAAERHGASQDTFYPASGAIVRQPFESNTAEALQAIAAQSVQQSSTRPPTLTLQPGARLSIHVMQDVDFLTMGLP